MLFLFLYILSFCCNKTEYRYPKSDFITLPTSVACMRVRRLAPALQNKLARHLILLKSFGGSFS